MTKKMATGLHSPVLANGGYPIVDGYVTSFDTMTHNVGSPPPMVGVGLLGRWKSIYMPQGVYPGVWKCISYLLPTMVARSKSRVLYKTVIQHTRSVPEPCNLYSPYSPYSIQRPYSLYIIQRHIHHPSGHLFVLCIYFIQCFRCTCSL